MLPVLIRAGTLLAVILLGWLLRRVRFLPAEAFELVSKIVIYVTLPCAIVTNFAAITIDGALLAMYPLGLACACLFAVLGYLVNLRRGVDAQVFDMLNFSGYNIGCFALPFVSGLLGPVAMVSVCLFDAGNAVAASGGTNAVCAALQSGKKFDFTVLGRRLLRSAPVLTYVSMLVLRLCSITLPAPILSFTETVGAANSFLAMFMLGLGMNLRIDRAQWRWIGKAFLIRFGLSAVLSFVFLRFLPFSYEVRLGAAAAALAPVSSLSPAFTHERGGDYGLSSSWSTVSIPISLVCTTVLLLLAGS